jgi:galactokinase
MNTRAEHSLDDGQYGNRRDECSTAARELGVHSLREIHPHHLDSALRRLSTAVLRRRVRHVVTENDRVTLTVAALDADDLPALSTLFDESHASMRDDFEISCPELDTAVETSRDTGALASRMTGGGFGGSAIAIVRNEDVDAISAAVGAAFADRGFRPPECFAVTADGPARRDR